VFRRRIESRLRAHRVEAEWLYRSDDGGETWSRVNEDQRLTQRAWYFTHIFADPKSADTVYMLNTGLFRSTDGGKTLNLLPAPHGDHHGFWIDPQNTNRMINSNDGGATISVDGGKSWSTQYNQPTAQFIMLQPTTISYTRFTAHSSRTTRRLGFQPHRRMAMLDASTGSTQAAARAATLRPIRVTRTLSMRVRGGGAVTRLDRRSNQETGHYGLA